MQGEATRQDFYIIRDNPVGPAPLPLVSSTGECCFKLDVLAELEEKTDDHYNDHSGPIFFWANGFSTADLVLQKYVGGVWTDVATLDDDTYGTAYPFGFFVNVFSQSAIGYYLDWFEVLNDEDLGEGNYRIKSTGTTLFGSNEVDKYSFEYCLRKYTPNRADKTVRITWNLNARVGDPEDDFSKRDFGITNWQNQIRLPNCMFGYDISSFERSFVKYQSGEMIWLEDSQVEEYTFKSGRYTNELHRFIKIDILQADTIIITDYNINNPTRHTDKYVIPVGNYEPNWIANAMLASVEVKFHQFAQNLNHKRA